MNQTPQPKNEREKKRESISLKLTHIANETTAETTAKSKKKINQRSQESQIHKDIKFESV